jgi:multiple sugar transport system substrate-binding protein
MSSDRFRVAIRKFGPFESAIARQWEAFEREHGTGLELEAVAMDLHPLFDSTIARSAECDFDVAFVNTDWVASAHSGGAFLDLAALIRDNPPEEYPHGWAPSMLRLQNVSGQVLGLPYHDGPECLIYRKDLLEAAGEAPPETWDDFQRLARLLHKPERGCSGTIFAAYPDGHNTVYDFCLQLWTRGGEVMDGGGAFQFDSVAALDALRFLREMVNDGAAVHPACREMDSVKSGLAFAAGEAALMVNWFGFAAMAETVAESRVKGRIGIAPVPHAAGHAGTSLNIYWVLAIPAGAAHAGVAWQFLRHCASAEMDRLLTLEGGIGCRRSTWADAAVNRAIPFYREMEGLHANAREMPSLEKWPEVAAVIDRMVLAAIDTDEPVESIARRGQAEAEQL